MDACSCSFWAPKHLQKTKEGPESTRRRPHARMHGLGQRDGLNQCRRKPQGKHSSAGLTFVSPRPPSPPCHRPQPCPLWLMRWNEYKSPCTPRHTTNTEKQQLPKAEHLPCARRPAEHPLSTVSFSVTLRSTLRAMVDPHFKDRRPKLRAVRRLLKVTKRR